MPSSTTNTDADIASGKLYTPRPTNLQLIVLLERLTKTEADPPKKGLHFRNQQLWYQLHVMLIAM